MSDERLLFDPDFPLSNKYDPEWILENEMGPNPLWLAEWLARELPLRSDMRVLDMGCAKALSSIFLAKEFGVTVFANDLWIDPTENLERIVDAGVENRVFPIRAEAHSLPYARDFFDAIISLDSYHYYGTDEYYISTITSFLKKGGRIGVAQPGVTKEFNEVPEHLRPFWDPEMITFHSATWWRNLWTKSETVKVLISDDMPNGCAKHVRFLEDHGKAGLTYRAANELEQFRIDDGRFLTCVRIVGLRQK